MRAPFTRTVFWKVRVEDTSSSARFRAYRLPSPDPLSYETIDFAKGTETSIYSQVWQLFFAFTNQKVSCHSVRSYLFYRKFATMLRLGTLRNKKYRVYLTWKSTSLLTTVRKDLYFFRLRAVHACMQRTKSDAADWIMHVRAWKSACVRVTCHYTWRDNNIHALQIDLSRDTPIHVDAWNEDLMQ